MIRIDILVRIRDTSDTTLLTHYGPGTIKDYNLRIIIKAKEIIDMVTNYLSDAKHFQKKSDFVNAFAAINYNQMKHNHKIHIIIK